MGIKSKFLRLMEFLLISIYSFLFFSHIWSFSYLLIFQDRDLDRARQLAQGSLIFFGPEVLGGGNLPGGFYYFLLSIPYFLGLDWSACWQLMIILLSAGIGLAWIFIVSVSGYYSAGIFIVLIFNSAALMIVEGLFLNPSFLPFFTICSIIGICLTFSNIPVSKNRYWIATCFLMGLSIQIHFNAFFILLSGIFLQLIANKVKITPLKKRNFFMGLVVFALTLFPYYLSNILSRFGLIVGQQAPFSSGQYLNAPPFLLRRLFDGLSGLSLESMFRMLMFQLQPEVLLCLCILPLGYWIFRRFSKQYSNNRETGYPELFKILLIIGAFNAVPQLFFFSISNFTTVYYTINIIFVMAFIAGAIPVQSNEGNTRIYYYLTAACLLIIALFKFLKAPEFNLKAMFEINMFYYIFIFTIFILVMALRKVHYATIALVIFMLLLPNISLKYNLSLAESSKLYPITPKLEEIKNLSRYIINETCWNFSTARKKIMRMNIFSEVGLREIYNEESKKTLCGNSGRNPDGYVISSVESTEDQKHAAAFPNEWLLSKKPDHVIHQYMMNHNLRVGKPFFFGNTALLEYDLKNPETGASLSIQNIGYAYEIIEFDKYFIQYPPGVSQISKEKYFIRWDNCPEDEGSCSVAYFIDLEGISFMNNTVKVSIIGQSLSSPSKCVMPHWSEVLFSPYITFECDGKRYKRELVNQLGGFLKNIGNSNLISAPFETHIATSCKVSTSKISIGWDKLILSSFSSGVKVIPDKPITINK